MAFQSYVSCCQVNQSDDEIKNRAEYHFYMDAEAILLTFLIVPRPIAVPSLLVFVSVPSLAVLYLKTFIYFTVTWSSKRSDQ